MVSMLCSVWFSYCCFEFPLSNCLSENRQSFSIFVLLKIHLTKQSEYLQIWGIISSDGIFNFQYVWVPSCVYGVHPVYKLDKMNINVTTQNNKSLMITTQKVHKKKFSEKINRKSKRARLASRIEHRNIEIRFR